MSKLKIPKREAIHQQAFYYLLLIQSFAFPLWKRITPIILSLIVLNWIMEFNFKSKTKLLISENKLPNFFLFISIYVLYVIGLIYTSNFAYASFDLEVKLTFLLIPVVFFSSDFSKFDKKSIIKVFISFIGGCFLSSILSMLHSYYLYQSNNTSFWFFYSSASAFHHPSYISMYLIFAMTIIVYLLINDLIKNRKLKYIFGLILIWFFIYVIMLSSKAGIFSLIIGIVFLLGYWIIKKRNYLISIIMIIIFILSIALGANKIPLVTNRITSSFQALKSNKNDVNIEDGTVQRMEIWKTSLDIIKDHFLIGVGTGDVKDELLAHYDKKGMTFAKANNLNAHGQFFQTFITLGFIGFLNLVLMFFIPLFQAIKKPNYIYLFFIIIVFINILVESMFENQAGVVFYTFFNSFLFLSSKQLRDQQ
ncbi:MAG: O-antigen ligase family protein [Bacteroidetes bacterium]|nr:O-antigen ligase family protein [Bacteroidota bacterium]